MALGARLVHELQLEPGVDTLSRWMAHHLAEAMIRADRTQGPEHEAAQARAVDLILKLWTRRHVLPGGAHPLKQFENVIAVLQRLQHDAWPFRRSARDFPGPLLTDAFDGLRFIVAHGILLASGNAASEAAAHEGAALLNDEEQFVLKAIQEWIEFCESGRRTDAPTLVVTEEEAAEYAAKEAEQAELAALAPKERSRRKFADRLDELIETLNALKEATSTAAETASGET